MGLKKNLILGSLSLGLVLSGFSGSVSAKEGENRSPAIPDTPYDDFNWTYPTTNYVLTDDYAVYRGGCSTRHKGIDVGVVEEPLYAVSDAHVKWAGYSTTAGYWVVLNSEDEDPYTGVPLTVRYLHLKKDSIQVETDNDPSDMDVQQGDIIGTSGNTGNSTGNHLHFDVNDDDSINGSDITYAKGNTIDPKYFWPNAPYQYDPEDVYTCSSSLSVEKKTVDTEEDRIALYLIKHVGLDKFDNWVNSLEDQNNLKNKFMERFDLTKKDLSQIEKEHYKSIK